jgi:DNA-binding transcriptional regulator YdaS (Cro superfamily)
MSPQDALKKAIHVLGTQTAVAAAAGPDVTTAHVYHWLNKASEVPAKHCPGIERATRAKGEPVFCEQLCPGTDWAAIRANTGPKLSKRAKRADGEVSVAVIAKADHPAAEADDEGMMIALGKLVGEGRDDRYRSEKPTAAESRDDVSVKALRRAIDARERLFSGTRER